MGICKFCSQEFIAKRSDKLFCNPNCCYKFWKVNNPARWRELNKGTCKKYNDKIMLMSATFGLCSRCLKKKEEEDKKHKCCSKCRKYYREMKSSQGCAKRGIAVLS